MDSAVLIVSPYHQRYADEVRRQIPGIRVEGCSGDADAPAELDAFDVALAWKLEPALLGRWSSLRWIQMVSAGADHLLALPQLRPEVAITSVRGIHAKPIASYVMAMMTALSLGLGKILENQRAGRWKQWGWSDLEGKTLCVAGMGAIGCEVARRARASGMRVLGVKRNPSAGKRELPAERLFGMETLPEALGMADFVVVALPLTSETRGLFDARMFGRLKEGSRLVNIARGEIVVEGALLAALEGGRLAGAALDVFEEEPLPGDSPLWGHEKVLITPHVAGLVRDYIPRVCRIFAENWKRWREGLPLENLVDRASGY